LKLILLNFEGGARQYIVEGIFIVICDVTGNDLARVLRWGPGYTGGEDPLNLLRDVIDAEEIRLDRWTVVFHPEDKADDKGQQPLNPSGKWLDVH
jgi:hypothetical protein